MGESYMVNTRKLRTTRNIRQIISFFYVSFFRLDFSKFFARFDKNCHNLFLVLDSTTGSPTPTSEAEPAKAPPPQQQPAMRDPHDECVLCAYPLPLHLYESTYKSCCGEIICNGCILAQQRTLIIGTNVKKPIKGSNEEEQEFALLFISKQKIKGSKEAEKKNREFMLLLEQNCVCPFCRTEQPINDKESLKSLYKQIDTNKDSNAMNMVGSCYMKGERGLPKNVTKGEEFYQRSYALGNPEAAELLAKIYYKDTPDKVRMLKYLEEGERRGNINCMVVLARRASQSGNCNEAVRLFMMAARSGHDIAMQNLMKFCNRRELLSKDDLATTLRVHKAANDAVKSEAREYAMRYKAFEEKMKGLSERM